MAAVGGPLRSQLGQPLPSQPSSRAAPYNAQQYNEMVMRLPNPTTAKAMSISSLSTGMSKLFRRRGDGQAAFDEDQGADFSDVTDGSNVLFNDLRYMHHQGNSTIPIIPTLGPSMNSSGTQLSNIQYRKQMNLQKKLAFASGARANSIQTTMGPPLARQGMPYDPRLMLLMGPGIGSAPGIGPGQVPGMGHPRDPRLMLMMGPGSRQPRDPRLMLMMLRPQNPYQQSQGLNGSKTWLLTGLANGMRQMLANPQFAASTPQSGWVSPQDMRTNSLNGMAPQHQQMHQNQHPSSAGIQAQGQGQYLQHSNYRNNQQQSIQANQQSNAFNQQQGIQANQQSNAFNQQQGSQANQQSNAFNQQSPGLLQNQQFQGKVLGQGPPPLQNFPQQSNLPESGQYPSQPHTSNPPIQTQFGQSDTQQTSSLGNPHYVNRPSWAPMLGQPGYGLQQQSPISSHNGSSMAPPAPIASPHLRQNHSSDSLMNVVEEDDESESVHRVRNEQASSTSYNSDEHANPLRMDARPSEPESHEPHTLAPTRLMRLRKLHLFDAVAKEDNLELPEKPESSAKSQSPEETSLSNKSTFDGGEKYSRLHRSSGLTSTSSSVATQSRHLLKELTERERVTDSSIDHPAPASDLSKRRSPEPEQFPRSQSPPHPAVVRPRTPDSNIKTPKSSTAHEITPLTIPGHVKGGDLKPRRSVTANTAFETFRQPPEPPKLAPELEPSHLTRAASRQLLASKSKSMFKRLSRRNTDADSDSLGSAPSLPATGVRPLEFSASRKASWTLPSAPAPSDDFHLTKEDLRIMTCNRELLEELLMVTMELAASIKREFVFEKQTRGEVGMESENRKSSELLNDKQTIALLQQKLNKEKQLRFISEEHAIFLEHGQQPLALKISYEKAEMYQQLLAKNQQISELEERVEELLAKQDTQLVDQNMYRELLENYQETVRNNEDLEARAAQLEEREQERNASISGVIRGGTVKRITLQREELRKVVTELSLKHALELKICNERVARAEARIQELTRINERLTHT